MEIEISRYIGLAQRANGVVYGLDNIKKADNITLLLACSTSSEKLYEELCFIAEKQNIPVYRMDYVSLDQILHTENCKVVGITNNHIAKQIEFILNKEN